jgi:hypothetical protein
MKEEQRLGTDNKQGVSGDEGLEYADKDSHQQVKQSTTQPPRERVSRIPILCNSPRVTPNRFEDAGKVVVVDSKSNAHGMTRSFTAPTNSPPRPGSN